MTSHLEEKYPPFLLLPMVVCALAVVCLLYFPVPILPLLTQNYHVTTAQAAGSLSAFGFAYAAGFLLFGALSDRLGRKIVMIYGLSALTLVTLCLAFVNNWQIFIALRVVQGLAAASFPPVALAYLSERGTPALKVRAIAWMSTAFLSAGILGQIYALEVAIPFGISWALVGLGVIYFLTILRFIFIKNEIPAIAAKSWLDTYKPLIFLCGNSALRRVYLSALLLLFCFVAFYLALDNYLIETMRQQGISQLQMRLVALPVFALTLFAPKLIAWFKSAHKVVMLGLVISIIGLSLAAVTANWHPMWILASSMIFVGGVSLSVPSLIARTAAVSDVQIRGIAVSFYTFMLFVGASLAPFLISILSDYSLKTVLLVLAWLLVGANLYNFLYKEDI